jgi:hypothetical protein
VLSQGSSVEWRRKRKRTMTNRKKANKTIKETDTMMHRKIK